MSGRLFVGVDVGLQGAVAFMQDDSTLLDVQPMPTDTIEVNGRLRERVAVHRLLKLLDGADGALAVIEEPEGRPMKTRDRKTGATVMRQPGAAGMLSLGTSYGVAYCACAAKGLAIQVVRPGAWKREVGVPGDKDECRRRASELWPDFAGRFARRKDDGMAEACLLALWGVRLIGRRKAA